MGKVIGIGGLSRSGKSTLAQWLHQQLPGSVMLCHDDFPQDQAKIPKVRDRIDWEHPDSINWSLWQKAITSQAADCDYLILEGLFQFREEALPLKPDYLFYLGIAEQVFLKARRKETRWGPEPEWYLRHVWDSHFQFGLPQHYQEVTYYEAITESDYPKILDQIRS